jgi:quinolinate synthase
MPGHILEHADMSVRPRRSSIMCWQARPRRFIVATEPHIIHQMEKAVPNKTFIGAPGADGNCNCNICPYMALNTIEKLYLALRDLDARIEIDEEDAARGEEAARSDAGDGGRDDRRRRSGGGEGDG